MTSSQLIELWAMKLHWRSRKAQINNYYQKRVGEKNKY